MPISDTSKVDMLWKKIGFGVAKTDSSSAKSGSNETIASPLPVYANLIWAQAGDIPAVVPGATTGVVQYYSGANRIAAVMDTTSTLNMTWKSNLTDWIPSTFNDNYTIKVYVGDPQTSGVQIFPDTTNNEFYFDYQAGLLNFTNSLPPNIANGIYFVGYRYVGVKGVGGGSSAGNIVVADIVARDALEDLSVGDIVYVTDASGDPQAGGPGEYAVYLWDGVVFQLIATQNSSTVDAKTFSVALTSASTGTVAIHRAGSGARIISCSVDVLTAFNGSFDFTVGTDVDQSWIMSENDHDVKSIGAYVSTPTATLAVGSETMINVYVTGTSTVGSAVVTITYA